MTSEPEHAHVVLVGNDDLGVRVLQELRELGVTVTAVCAQPDAPFARAARGAEVPLVVGDPEHEDTMREAGVEGASTCGLLANADLANVHTALALQELAPRARIILRLFNTSLADAVRGLVEDMVVLSRTELAAPAFVEAALRGSADFVIRVGDRQVAVQEVEGDDPRLRLALTEAGDGESGLFPVDGARVVGIVDYGRAPETRETSPEPSGGLDVLIAQRHAGFLATAERLWRTGWVLVRGTVAILDRRLAVVGVLFVLLAAASALVFSRYLGISLLDGLYFVVTTVTTTGYGDINLLEAPAPLKLYGIAIMIFGGLVIALVFGLVTDAIVGARLARALGQQPVPRRDHVIVCGIGRISSRIIEALVEAGVPCVVVGRDDDARETALLRRLRVPLIVGNPGSEESFDDLRLESARALMAVTDDDEANLQCALLAQARAPHLRLVLHLFDPDLAARVERAAGIYFSRSVSTLAAPAFVAAILGHRAAAVLPIGSEILRIVDLTAERTTDVRTLEDACQARVLAVAGTAFPEPGVSIAPGDEVRVVGTSLGLAEIERRAVTSVHGADERGEAGGYLQRGERAVSITPLPSGEVETLGEKGASRMSDQQTDRDTSRPEQAREFGTVFWVTVAISAAFVLWGVLSTETFSSVLTAIVGWITTNLGWVYMLITAFFLVFVIVLAVSPYGKIKLGRDEDEPEFGYFAWFAMLFQAGMGIGIVFWGVAEPVFHYNDPPLGLAEARTPDAASLAMQTAFFHWTLHPWAMYATIGVAVAYFSYRKGMGSLRISTVFRPLIGDRADGPIGKAIDIISIIATLFGVAVSLGLGTLQIAAGLNSVFGLPSGIGLLMIIIAVTAIAYMLSASTPLEKGINYLSQGSMYLAALLLVYFVVVGPTLLQLNTFTQEIGGYLINLVPRSLNLSAFNQDEQAWLSTWTIFFWATWIAWGPYVGAFIARISRGRTIREFIVGVMIGPSVFSMIWFAVFGAAGIRLDDQTNGQLYNSVQNDGAAVALFEFLRSYPLALITSLLALFLIYIFFVAGADAGTVVLGSMSSDNPEPRLTVKLTWGIIMAAIAAVLLVVGGGGATALTGLTNGAILAATPFGILMVPMCYGLYKTLAADYREERRQEAKIRLSPATQPRSNLEPNPPE